MAMPTTFVGCGEPGPLSAKVKAPPHMAPMMKRLGMPARLKTPRAMGYMAISATAAFMPP